MKNARYKIVERPTHSGGTWYDVYIKRYAFFGLFSWWDIDHVEEKLTRAEEWIELDKLKKLRESQPPFVRYY